MNAEKVPNEILALKKAVLRGHSKRLRLLNEKASLKSSLEALLGKSQASAKELSRTPRIIITSDDVTIIPPKNGTSN